MASLFLIAGTCERTRRIVFVGKNNAWQYDKPHGLHAFETRGAAELGSKAFGVDLDEACKAVFGSIAGLGDLLGGVPKLIHVSVVEYGPRIPRPEPPKPAPQRPRELYLVKVTRPNGTEIWFGRDPCPGLKPWGLRGFDSETDALGVMQTLKAMDKEDAIYEVKTLVQKLKERP